MFVYIKFNTLWKWIIAGYMDMFVVSIKKTLCWNEYLIMYTINEYV